MGSINASSGWRLLFLYALFTLSGLAGLIYESIWAHYLKLFLGHAAYAQTLVLVIFMGGMAAGAWMVAGMSRRLSHPLMAYAWLELALGVAGWGFDPLFRSMQAWFFDGAILHLKSPLVVELAKWGLSGAIILPQSMLLGATFPLISAGIIRLKLAKSGSALGWLYFANSLGASAGVLLSGFFLIDHVGLPGTLLFAGATNFFLALTIYLLGRSQAPQAGPPQRAQSSADNLSAPRLLLVAAGITGAASFLYEIGWIRMLSLVLGSTTHSFELMLSVFILGLALGSFWVRNRIDSETEPLRLLGWVQLVMAAMALLSLPLYMRTFDAMAVFWNSVQSNDGGYGLFTAFSYLLCALLMLPATFCAGMTLPLMTAALLRSGYGERSIGRIYAANTIGAIAGILLAVHCVMPWMGLRQVVVAGALLDLALGIWLLQRYRGGTARWRRMAIATLTTLPLLLAVSTHFDPAVTGSGAYRVGKARLDAELVFHADGKTATVDVVRYPDGTVSIATNGKVDAGLNLKGVIGPDDYTMVMLAALPMALHPQARTAAVIGMGSGTSTHVLLHNPRFLSVDTIEIEPAIVEGARNFGAATEKGFTDPRSRILIEDAKSYFARAGQQYDLIISEPSNPWVSGIASLFSGEFYRQVKRYLAEDGLFVQWLHLYEISPQLIATVMNALGASFADYAIYATNGDDIMIVATKHGSLPAVSPWMFSEPGLRPILDKLALRTVADLEVRKLGGKSTLQSHFLRIDPRANSDYFPVLDQGAARQRFVIGNARGELLIHPYSLRLEQRGEILSESFSPPQFSMPLPGSVLAARALAERFLLGTSETQAELSAPHRAAAALLRQAADGCSPRMEGDVMLDALRVFTQATANLLPMDLARRVVARLQATACHTGEDEVASAWRDFYRGVSLARPEWVHGAAPTLLQNLLSDPASAQFVLAEWLMADLTVGRVDAAARRLQQVKGLPDSPPLAYLRSYIDARRMSLDPES